MLNRRLIRIKSFKVLYAAVGSGSNSLESAQKELLMSCEKTRELFYFLLNITGAIVNVAEDRIEAGLKKFHPSAQEANPNRKFVNNKYIEILLNDAEFGKFCRKRALNWGEYDVFVKKIYNSIISSDYYAAYMASDTNSFEEDCDLIKSIFEEEFEDNDGLSAILEEMSLYWIDDVAYTINIILNNIELTKKIHKIPHPNVFFKEEDKDYGIKLLGESLINYDEYMSLISKNVSNWDSERLVSTDATLIVMGIAEATYFPNIPIKVTINEYVEISKFYSTPNSRIFVNGLLDKIIQKKIASGEIVKTGRGLLNGTKIDK